MAYIVPSVQVYQQLENAGGVAATTPDLDACVIGPAYNVLTYAAGSSVAQLKTAAISTTTTTGDMVAASNELTNVAATGGYSVDDEILVIGAGDSGANLRAVITAIAGNTFTLDTEAATSVTGAVVSKSGKITNPTISNTFELPGQIAGQVVDASTIKVYVDNAKIETVLTGFYGYHNSATITINNPSGALGDITAAATALTLSSAASAAQFAIGDDITVAGAGAAGATLTAKISNISGTNVTLDTAASTTVTSAAVAKVAVSNVNSTTGTLKADAGDDIKVTYTTISGSNTTFSTKIKSITTTSGLNGNIQTISLNDVLPEDFSMPATTGTVGASSTSLSVASASGFSTGDTVRIYGAGASGAVHETTITVSGTTFTLGVAATTAVTDATVVKVIRSTGAISAGATTIELVTGGATHFSAGDRVVVVGAGANGADLLATVSSVSAPNITIGTATVTALASAAYIRKVNNFQVSLRRTYEDQLMAATRPISGGANYSTASAATNGQVTINANPELVYGKIMSADVYMGYKALRTDLIGTVQEYNDITDVEGELGEISDENPLALGLQIALANTTGRVFGIGVDTDDLTGHEKALTLLENQKIYSLAPLTQSASIVAAYQAHVEQMSTPENASWRISFVNTAIPLTQEIGDYNADTPNSNGGQNQITLVTDKYILTANNATFITDGVIAGDTLVISAATPSTVEGSYTVQEVISNQQVVIDATATATAVSYYVKRSLTKAQQATAVAAASETFGSSRVIHVQPDLVGVSVDGVVKQLPGYYLCCALAGMVAGFPVQQGFTNIGLAGIDDLYHSNFYFSKTDLGTMAEKGTFLVVQATQSGVPYVRHEVTTDMSVLEYRELLVVKNWDYLSYYYQSLLAPFIGSWNVTQDTINNIRQSVIAGSEQLKTKKLPKIGAPLNGYEIVSIAQNASNKDNIDVKLNISVVYPNNYTNVYLII